jgi:large subunit ribosomal protein L4
MANIEIKDSKGKKVGTHSLSEAISSANPSPTTVHRTIVAEQAAARQGTQKTKTRSEVRGGGRKPYKQKKTGNARQGTIRAPHYAHGGMALALTPRDYDKKVNRKERRATILGVLADKFGKDAVVVVDSIKFAEPKTKAAIELLKAVGLDSARRVLVVLPQVDDVIYKSFRNLTNVTVRTAPASTAEGAEAVKTAAFSARDAMVATHLLIVTEALTRIEEVWGK